MAYRINKFDGLAIPQYIDRADNQSMGTGRAASRVDPLPGGGFYDHYADLTLFGGGESPPAMDDILKSGEIHSDGAGDVQAQIQAWRAKMRKAGRLEITFHDSTVWWQNARLVQAAFPVGFEHSLTWCPFRWRWEPLDGYWKADAITTDANTLTDADTSEDIVIANPGTRKITDFTIRYEVNTTSTTGLTITNRTTGQQISFGSLALSTADEVRIHIGDGWMRHYEAEQSVSAASRNADGTQLRVVKLSHGYSAGNHIYIAGSVGGAIDNHWPSITLDGSAPADVFLATWPPTDTTPISDYGFGATMRKYNDIYGEVTVLTNRRDWMTLAPGNNTIRIDRGTNTVADDIITFEYYAAYK